jgi:hypothetical protein
MAHILETPRTEVGDATRYQSEVDFSMEQSFHAPVGRDTLFKQMAGARTPRNPLATMRNANARPEFTPMLKSATANRTKQVNGLLNGKITTPAALKPGFSMSNTPLPEASSIDIQSSSFAESIDGRTPVPDPSSSAMSTPMALPRRAEGELDNGNGNVLTLREQEAVSTSCHEWTSTWQLPCTAPYRRLTCAIAPRTNRQGKLWPQAQDPLPRREP